MHLSSELGEESGVLLCGPDFIVCSLELLQKWLSLFWDLCLELLYGWPHGWPHIAPKCSPVSPSEAEVGGLAGRSPPKALHGQSFRVLRLNTHLPSLPTQVGVILQPGSSSISRAGSLHKHSPQLEEKKPDTAASRLERREQLKKANTLPTSVTGRESRSDSV